jgi:uncharacterized lipoprotein YajG
VLPVVTLVVTFAVVTTGCAALPMTLTPCPPIVSSSSSGAVAAVVVAAVVVAVRGKRSQRISTSKTLPIPETRI